MKDAISQTQMEAISALASGDHVEAYDDSGGQWLGVVDIAAYNHGIVWIHSRSGERKLLDVKEHTIRRVHAPPHRAGTGAAADTSDDGTRSRTKKPRSKQMKIASLANPKVRPETFTLTSPSSDESPLPVYNAQLSCD
ncbi:hypothetical protein [Arthrobacter sp. I3]|uniref:hypothetical protein n=1 Tax=Arthrobacter sp. I3 TaxID=218158 RepID=UPI0012EC34C3|nr:hypothetical protein [Arthrobacter sp. I3]